MNPTEDEETDDLSVIYHRGGLDAVYQVGRADGIADTFHGISAISSLPDPCIYCGASTPLGAHFSHCTATDAIRPTTESEEK